MVSSIKQASRATLWGLGRAFTVLGSKLKQAGCWIEQNAFPSSVVPTESRESLSDELGRREFAKSLTQYIANVNTRSTYVRDRKSTTIGVYGEWGSGKTYLKNLVLREIQKLDKEIPHVEYNPWQWSAQEKLTESFFDTLEGKFQELGATNRTDAKEYSEISKKIRKLSLAMSVFGPSPRFIAALQTLLFGVIAYFLGTADWNEWPSIAQVVAIIGTVAGLAFWFFGHAAERIASWIEINSSLAERSLERVKEDLTDLFADLDQPFLVVIDDMDRLTAEQIRMMMQLIKANADFPNVVYLVLFEQDIVTGSLSDEENNIEGDKFLKKIVHLSFELPMAGQNQLVREFRKRLGKELESREIPEEIVGEVQSDTRLDTVIDDLLPDFVHTLRNVNRVLPTFVFYLEHYIKQTEPRSDESEVSLSLEVNPGDLLALELLRIFEPEVHLRVVEHKKFLTTYQVDDMKEERQEKALDGLLNPINDENGGSKERRERAKQLLAFLFPNLQSSEQAIFGLLDYDFDNLERRVSDWESFDRYFERRIPKGQLRKAEIKYIVDNAGDQSVVRSELEEMSERSFEMALQEFRSCVSEIDIEDYPSFLAAIFDASADKVLHRPADRDLINAPSLTRAWQLINSMMKKKGSTQKSRGDALNSAVDNTDAILLPLSYILNAIDLNEEYNLQGRELLYKGEHLNQAKDKLLDEVRSEIKSKALFSRKHVAEIILLWCDIDVEEAKHNLEDAFSDDAHLTLKFLGSLVDDSHEKHISRTQKDRLSELGILEILIRGASEIDESNLNAKGKTYLNELNRVTN